MAKILIIDDRQVNREFLTTLLGYQHHLLSEASDGADGLRVAREQRPALIICDVLMPTMDGYEFVIQLRADPDIGKTPVIFSTAHYLSRESKALADKCGVTSIINKPCDPQCVLDIVAAALNEQPLEPPAALQRPEDFDREHLRLVTDKVAESANEIRAAHETLSALTMSYITDHELSEETASKLASIVESAHDAIIGKTRDGIITSWNRGAQKLYGYSAEEVLGRSIAILAPPDLTHEVDAILARLTGGELIEDFETERMTKAGERICVSLTISPIRGKSGTVQGWSTIARDITERNRLEEARSASELRYRRLFESAQDGILILNSDPGQIIDANPYIIKAMGYSYEELLGKELWEIGFFRDVAEAKDAFEELRKNGYVRYEDLPLKTREGLTIEVDVVSNIYPVGDSKVIQCNIRDVTARKRGERALAETNRKLEATVQELSATTQQLWQASKLATVGELSASIAHELNNPLATVALRVETLLMHLAADDQQRHPLEVITQEVDRMAALVDNLLQFSRRSHRQITTVNLDREISKSIDFVHYHLRTHKIEVVREFADPLPTIQADCQRLRQLFLNLLTNASDAMPRGGTLIVRAKTSVLGETEAVQIEFVDNGEGIAAENLKKIWDPFFTTKIEGKGTGLGLAICRRIVEEHGGAIEIESQEGLGTTVRMLFAATVKGVQIPLG